MRLRKPPSVGLRESVLVAFMSCRNGATDVEDGLELSDFVSPSELELMRDSDRAFLSMSVAMVVLD